MQNFVQATADYESWLSHSVELHRPDLDYKHQQMASEADSFPFFRGTYYRWAQHWRQAAADLQAAPVVLCVGDLHLENFGTWRDAEGRLVWGVNDFDEADYLPYTQDLARLAASVSIARRHFGLTIKLADACHCLLEGYSDNLQQGGRPFVLEESNPDLRGMALHADRDPVKFWAKLTKLFADPAVKPPAAAMQALLHDLPDPALRPEFRFRTRAGVGSLGKPRFIALVEWAGSWVAREAKAATPPATAWLAGNNKLPRNLPALLASESVRCIDPFYQPGKEWITRRLAPRCSRIDLAQLRHAKESATLLRAMGAETANMHVVDRSVAAAVATDLKKRGKYWLGEAAHNLAELIEADWQEWKKKIPLR